MKRRNGRSPSQQAPNPAGGLASAIPLQLFPFHLLFDSDLRIIHPGEGLTTRGITASGGRIGDDLQIVRPAGISTSEEIERHLGETFLLEARASGLRLFGPIVRLAAGEFLFIGSLPETGAGFSLINLPPAVEAKHLRATSQSRRRRLRIASLPGRVADALAQAGSQNQTLTSLTDLIGATLCLDLGVLWAIDHRSKRISCREIRPLGKTDYRKFEQKLRAMSFTPGNFAPGRSWARGEPLLISDIPSDHAMANESLEAGDLPASAITFPILLGGETIGLLEFFSHDRIPRQHGLIPVLKSVGRTVGRQIGNFIEQRNAEIELREAREMAEAVSVARGRFLANVSHEIRTPMNAIVGLANLLLETASSPEEKDYLETIRTSADVLLRIVSDLLDISKIESGRMEIVADPFRLRDCVEEAAELFALEAAHKSLVLSWLIDEAAPSIVRGDATRLRQVLINLIGNAVRFTDVGSVTIEVGAEPRPDNHWQLLFAVRDTGIGIPAADIERLFQPFSQVDSSAARRHGGTGLGLAICQRLVGLMSGTISVESRPGLGSTFSFTIRVEKVEPAEVPDQPAEPNFAGRRTLLVVPSAEERAMLRQQLRTLGLETVETDSHKAARQLLSGQKFDAVLVNHPTATRDQSAASEPDLAAEAAPDNYPPVVLLTRKGSTPSPKGRTSLPYPVRTTILGETLRSILDHRQPTVSVSSFMAPRPLQILVVEDNPVNRKVARLILERLGYRPETASNGAEALAELNRQRYDVLLMDLQMPEMDGIETTRRIRQSLPSAYQPRIVAITASVLPEQQAACLAAGMDDYLPKPLDSKRLSAILGAVDPAPPADQIRTDLPAEIITLFFSDAGARVDRMRSAIAAGNTEALRREAHALVGSAHTVGAHAAGTICETIEDLARRNALSEAPPLLDRLEASLAPLIRPLPAVESAVDKPCVPAV